MYFFLFVFNFGIDKKLTSNLGKKLFLFLVRLIQIWKLVKGYTNGMMHINKLESSDCH